MSAISSLSSRWIWNPEIITLSKYFGIASTITGLLFIGRHFIFRGKFVPRNIWNSSNLAGQVVIVTGCSKGGMGFETAKALYKRGATVVMACRDVLKGEREKNDILGNDSNSNRLFVMKVDFMDLNSVKNFATGFKNKYHRLDILVNNAGMPMSFGLTKQQVESHFGVNYLASFLLTNLLLDLMKKTSISYDKDCRIINVTSSIHFSLKSEQECLLESEYIINNDGSQIMPGLFQAYRRSKLCNALFTQMIYKQVKEESMDSSIIGVYCLHPGVVATNAFRASTKIAQIFADSFLGKYMLKTPLGGAQTSIFLSLAPFKSLHNGGYYDNCKLKQHSVLASSKKLQEKLWLISRDLCKDFLQ